MKVKDLPDNVTVSDILVKIPDNIKIPDYGTVSVREVYIRNFNWDGTLFVSLKPNSERIYPILSYQPNPLEWEVVDPRYTKIKINKQKRKKK